MVTLFCFVFFFVWAVSIQTSGNAMIHIDKNKVKGALRAAGEQGHGEELLYNGFQTIQNAPIYREPYVMLSIRDIRMED